MLNTMLLYNLLEMLSCVDIWIQKYCLVIENKRHLYKNKKILKIDGAVANREMQQDYNRTMQKKYSIQLDLICLIFGFFDFAWNRLYSACLDSVFSLVSALSLHLSCIFFFMPATHCRFFLL